MNKHSEKPEKAKKGIYDEQPYTLSEEALLEKKVREKYRALTLKLIEEEKSITTMESCTAGLIASLITDTEGASAILKGACVTYSNEAKIMAGGPEEVIRDYSVYSTETAAAMAEAAKKTFRADLAVGITGTTGNVDPENAAFSTPGVIFFSIADQSGTENFRLDLPGTGSRFLYKLRAADAVCDALMSTCLSPDF